MQIFLTLKMMLLIGWTSMVITTVFGRKHTFVIPLGLVLGGVSVVEKEERSCGTWDVAYEALLSDIASICGLFGPGDAA